jgi:phosphonate transport system permease protein
VGVRLAPAGLTPADIRGAEARCPAAFRRSPAERLRLAGGALLAGTVIGYCLWRAGFLDLPRWLQGAGKLGWVLGFMFPPVHGGNLLEFLRAIAETLGMAFLGTFLAAAAAVPMGFAGARNILPGWSLHFGLRRWFDALRGIDTLIWALAFIHVVGLGPFAGIMAIAVADAGTLAKLFAEAVENVDRKPVEGVRATGANRVQVVRFGIFPQALPVFLSQALYYFESNTRSATILGVVGAGGIGLQLSDRIRVNDWQEAAFIIILILVTVSLIDLLSSHVRHRVLAN